MVELGGHRLRNPRLDREGSRLLHSVEARDLQTSVVTRPGESRSGPDCPHEGSLVRFKRSALERFSEQLASLREVSARSFGHPLEPANATPAVMSQKESSRARLSPNECTLGYTLSQSFRA